MKKLTLLGGVTPAQFLKEFWHKKPCVIRQAIPGFAPIISREALFEMAGRDDVESRLVTHFRQKWEMQSGPLDAIPAITKRDWTLLVQGVNLHDDAADALLRQFNFLPDARLDDLMISYATDAGGVGPHVDSYDVFLLQAQGTRRWRIGAQQDLTLQAGVPLKILQRFAPSEEFDLEPGDMLYLPPNYAHEGVAIGECMTYSIGFRAPSYQELGESFLQFMTDSIDLPGQYADAELAPTTRPAEISAAMLAQVSAELNKVQFTRDDIAIFLGEYLSEPKSSVSFEPVKRPLTLDKFMALAGKRGVRLSRKTQMLYRGELVFINGESFAVSRADKALLSVLADQRTLDGEAIATASLDVAEALHDWYRQGWLLLEK
ncbi:50S ribosomal protein L16 3-hydroxylase [Actimicrobium sp. GrIS 1.19]|uniref:ribosomal protein uL16 3-hydroxylase n=1 Tax=Actimicrobium sp. GrIS 1.19 TaxID=3071708 RepID=UPI002E07F62D|nr:50S ribosomal protein L16 3-hydroxylase [Actimicrobium sp. GrIS 1.19]